MAMFKETFMDAFDENQDGMIDIAEVGHINIFQFFNYLKYKLNSRRIMKMSDKFLVTRGLLKLFNYIQIKVWQILS